MTAHVENSVHVTLVSSLFSGTVGVWSACHGQGAVSEHNRGEEVVQLHLD